MFRGAILAAGLVLAAASFVHAQQPTAPPVPEDAMTTRELIAWSSLQTPQPAQQQPAIAQTHPVQDAARRPIPSSSTKERQQPIQPQNTAQSNARDPRTRTR